MENALTGSLPFVASDHSVLVSGLLGSLAAGVAWALYRYHYRPSCTRRRVGVKTQQALRRYVLFESTHRKPDSVLQAFREYASKDRVMRGLLFTVEQESFLEEAVKQCQPKTSLVLGTQCGYSAIRLLRLVPSDGILYAVEQEESMADSAEEMILVAGFKNNQFKVLCQHPVDAIHVLKSQFGLKKVDLVLMDSRHDQHGQGLMALAEVGILHPGTLILVNNKDCPRSKGFMKEAKDYRKVDACKGLLKVEYVQPK
ncbi:catechol O-methyltransferase-like [Dendropsophus ebraccatus]|uniref:catechol O-methyltransferase-like n=1 Tax=Dendropsophus ebraccatus TaxID=150705 RepID=UPI00383172F1